MLDAGTRVAILGTKNSKSSRQKKRVRTRAFRYHGLETDGQGTLNDRLFLSGRRSLADGSGDNDSGGDYINLQICSLRSTKKWFSQ